MTRKILMIFFGAATVALIAAGKHDGESVLKSSGSHISSTGAPGEQTCAAYGCHSDATVERDDNQMVTTLILGDGEKTYTPATQYNVTIRAAKAGVGRFGFQVVALDSNNRYIGKFAVPQNYNRVQLQTGLVGGASRTYVTHTTAGNKPVINGEIEWRFLWTTPLNYQGKVTFYYCVNVTNMDNTLGGDHLYLASPSYQAAPANAVENEPVAADFHIFPTVASDFLTVENQSGFGNNATLEIVSGGGIIMQKIYPEEGSKLAVIPVGTLPNGVYSLLLATDETRLAKRFVMLR